MTKRIVLCADDYGQAPAISQGILKLIEANRLSATSCMVNGPNWSQHANWLAPFAAKVDVGLHFNLTQGQPLSAAYRAAYGEEFSPLATVMRLALMRKLSQAAVEAELNAQLDCFAAAFGHLPRFVDGHQHVHQFPIIRAALMKVYTQRLHQAAVCIRLVNPRLKMADLVWDSKKVIIYCTGTVALKALLDQYNIPFNQSFAGIYSFSSSNQYGALFPGFVAEVGEGGLIMCHPGLVSTTTEDPIANSRYAEYTYLASDQFLADSKTQDWVLTRFATPG